MFRFERDQKIWDIAGVEIGGQPGSRPTVMIGSIFYEGCSVVKDDRKGKFDEELAVSLLEKEEELSRSTGNPRIIDVVGSTSESLIRYIEFIAEFTDSPFLIDGATSEVRIDAAKHVDETGLSERAIYNSIGVHCKEEELETLRDTEIDSAILLCYNMKNPKVEGRIESLGMMLNKIEGAGINKPLVDPGVLDVPDPGLVSKSIYQIKEIFGLPAGCGAHNAVDQWRQRVSMNSKTNIIAATVANVFPIIMGADFILYGPIEKAEDMYTACSIADAYVAYYMKINERLSPEATDHPLYKIFKT